MQKMKSLYKILTLAAILFTATACTRNNGDIGDWFGTWKLDNITIDGVPDKNYGDNVVWKFQSDIISMCLINDAEHSSIARWGTWQQVDDRIILNFTYKDDEIEPGTNIYQPIQSIYLPGGIMELTVVTLSRSKIVLRYTSADNIVYTYSFSKWG